MRIHPRFQDAVEDAREVLGPQALAEELSLFALMARAFSKPFPVGGLMSDPILIYKAACVPFGAH